MIQFNFCPKCGGALDTKLEPPHCDACDITYYRNAKPCASVLPVRDGKVLLSIRADEPFKGAYDIIGGFMEAYELPEQAALREAKEETNLDMRIVELLGIYSDRYGDNGDYTLNMHYIAEITGGDMRAQDDAADLMWVDIDKVPLDSGFQNTRDGLRDLQVWYAKHKSDR